MRINYKTNENKDEPRWLAVVARLATALIYAALPSNLSVGPRWLLLAVMVAVVIPTLISHGAGLHTVEKMLGFHFGCWGPVSKRVSVNKKPHKQNAEQIAILDRPLCSAIK